MSARRHGFCGLAAWLAIAAPAAAQRPPRQADSARDCAVCHLSWVDAFQSRPQSTLIEPPSETAVSDEATCLGCHDGSVTDSRRKVWLQHGHQTGVKPSASVTVPSRLPLVNGALACRTCHSAHSGQAPETLANAIFIRVPNEKSQLCQLCHTSFADGPSHGRHPLGSGAAPIPEPLIAAGGRAGATPREIICQTCHAPHGAKADQLLVATLEGGALCLTCHAEMRPGMFLADTHRTRSRNPPLAFEERLLAIREMGTRAGEGNLLICSSCHKMHDAVGGRFLLADRLSEARLCLRCHSDYAAMTGSSHDLTRSAPGERNRFDQTAETSGPCMACHGFHRFAREPAPRQLDVTGLCTTCHREGQCAGEATGLPFGHPTSISNQLPDDRALRLYPGHNGDGKTMACLTCHDPHETRHGLYLRQPPDAICADCHAAYADPLSNGHDFRTRPEARNARGRTGSQTGACGFCHAVHGPNVPALWAATPKTPADASALCTDCHRPEGLGAATAVPELRHPTGAPTALLAEAHPLKLPLFDAQGRRSDQGAVACPTCHDPHAGAAASPALLRMVDSGRLAALCTECHRDVQPVQASMHSPERLAACISRADDVSPIEECRGCHRSHAHQGMGSVGMWAGPSAPSSSPEPDAQCLACHGPGGCSTRIMPREHPAVSLQNVAPPGTPGHLPLAPDGTGPGAEGRITCITCHLPHGRPPAPGDRAASALSESEFRATKPMLRPYVPPNLCTSCHGFEGLTRFLYFHAR